MLDDYCDLPYEEVSRRAESGDSAAHLELARRHMESARQAARADPEKSTGKPASNPSVRNPFLWAAFLVVLGRKAVSMFGEPIGLSLLLYAIYTIFHKVYYGDVGWGDSWDRVGGYIFALLLLVGLAKLANKWLESAWKDRPLSIFIMITIIVCWYNFS